MSDETNRITNSSKSKGRPNAILRYSGMATQMMTIILAAVFSGRWLDSLFATSKPYYTGVLTIVGVVLSMYFAIKDLLKDGSATSFSKPDKPNTTPET